MSMEIEPFKDTLGSPDVLNTAHKLASQINGTDFVPKAFRGKPEAVMAALLTGRELGLGPMTALQRIHVIEGKAGRYDALRLVVERTRTVNTTASGGNASLLSLADDEHT